MGRRWRLRPVRKVPDPAPTAPVPAPGDMLESVVRAGAQALLQAAWEVEVDKLLGRPRYARRDEFRGYRDGHLPERTIGVGMGALAVRVPGVRGLPQEVAPGRFTESVDSTVGAGSCPAVVFL
jgi:hypothetical protein